jgi:integrase
MTDSHSSTGGDAAKPAKPYPDFPLFPHATKRWAKKIKGKLRYFGPWNDPEAALRKYLDQRDDLHAGRVPRAARGGLLVRELLNKFLTAKQQAVQGGQLSPMTFATYFKSCARMKAVFGLATPVESLCPDDFVRLRGAMSTLGPAAQSVAIVTTRTVFRWAFDSEWIDKIPRFGPAFKAPSVKTLRKGRQAARRENGLRMFERDEVHKLLAVADPTMRAMILLGCNCGFGNNDLAALPRDAVDLASGWINHPRPKTGEERRCPLWPETIAALREAYGKQATAQDARWADLVFLTRRGMPLSHQKKPKRPRAGDEFSTEKFTDCVGSMFKWLLRRTGLERKGRGFYGLRHTFETVAGESRDQVATNLIMGHVDSSMASVYRERVDDARLLAVVNYVRTWLFAEGQTE